MPSSVVLVIRMQQALWLPQELNTVTQKASEPLSDEAWLARAAFNRLADAPQWALVEAAAVAQSFRA